MLKFNLQKLYHLLPSKLQQHFHLINKRLFYACLAELIGTFILMTIGLGTMIQRILRHHTNEHYKLHLGNVPTGWSIAFLLSQTIITPFGCGIMNPAMTFSLAIINKIPFNYVLPFTIIQLISSFVSSLLIYFIYYKSTMVEKHMNLIFFNQFIPTPSASHYVCFIDRLVLTAIATVFVLLIRDERNECVHKSYRLIYVALFTAGRIGAFSMNAGTSINPIRDLSPRIVLALCELGLDAFKKDHYYFWIPTVAPYIGSIIGAILYEITVGAYLNKKLMRKLNKTITISQSQSSSSSIHSMN
ncbi:unnamed protein product [Schistosoma turkestanicum]|nr:unnamed protein product [Schistosoma turkestanicum]